MTSMMTGLWIDSEKQVVYKRDDLPEPALTADEVIIRPACMGVCSTDLELARGYMGFTGVPGHEFVGTVEQAADAANSHWIGQRVVGRINCPLEPCDLCDTLGPEHARKRTVLGILARHGVFAERFALPAANLLAVPDTLDDETAVFTEPVAAALQILEQIQVTPDQRVRVLGDGRMGILCAQVLASTGASVQLLGKHASKMAIARSLGLEVVAHDTLAPAMDCDLVVDCTGSRSGITLAMGHLRPRGTLVLKTTVATPAPDSGEPYLNLAPIVINELNVVGSRCGPFDKALALLARNGIAVKPLIGQRMTLADGPAILEAAKAPGIIKTLVTP